MGKTKFTQMAKQCNGVSETTTCEHSLKEMVATGKLLFLATNANDWSDVGKIRSSQLALPARTLAEPTHSEHVPGS